MIDGEFIRIGPSYYKLTIEPLEDDEHGKSHADNGYIKISDKLTQEKRASTLLHEIMHMILDEYNIKISSSLEERVIMAIEAGLCGLAKDEKNLFMKIIDDMSQQPNSTKE